MEQSEQKNDSFLQRISNILLINGGFLNNTGLYSGETGLVLFFFRYAYFTQNRLYKDYGFALLEKVQNRINRETPIGYKEGLTGIGSAFEYLVQNGLIEACTDDILEEFDKRIFSADNLPFLSLDDLLGIGYYALWRITGNSCRKDTIRQTILPQVVDFMDQKCDFQHPAVSFFRNIVSIENPEQDRLIISKWRQLCCEINPAWQLQKYASAASLSGFNIGIQNGLAGLGLTFMTESDGDDSWMTLFPGDIFSKTDNNF